MRGRHDTVGTCFILATPPQLLIRIRHLSDCTTIPVPKVLAYCLENGSDPLSTFVILEYIDGKLLSPAEFYDLSVNDRSELYKSLADVYIQLRRQEFPSIGKLKARGNGVYIGEKTASIEMNMMQLEGLDPFSIQNSHHDERGLLASADTYTKMLLSIGYNAFLKSRNAVTPDMGLETLYNHFLFTKQAQDWVDHSLDEGPFVLVHGDFHLRNILVDNKMRLIGLIDWEWSRVVPVQYFIPPLWLSKRDAAQLAYPDSWILYMTRHFSEFLTIVKSQEDKMYGNSILHDEWAKQTEDIQPLIANALENWTEVDWFIHQNVYNKDPAAAETALSAFADEDPLRPLLAELKEQDYHRYQEELDLLLRDTNAESKIKTAETQGTFDWAASTQKLQDCTGIIGVTIATVIVLAAICAKLRPSPTP